MTSRNNAMAVELIECTPTVDSIEMSVIPWVNWCRLCAKERNKLWNEVDDDEKPNVHFIKAVEMFFNVKIHDDDLMPKYLCQECMTVVNNTIAYNEHVLNVQNMYCHLIDNSDDDDFERLRSEFKVGTTETKSIFTNYNKAIISFQNSSSNLESDLDDNHDDNPNDNDCSIQKHEMDSIDSTISDNIENNSDLDPLTVAKQNVDRRETSRKIILKTGTAKTSKTAKCQIQKSKPVIVLEDNTHQPLDLNCKECNHHISSMVLYEEHLRKAHLNLLKADIFKCLDCEITYENIHQLKTHYKNIHQPVQPIYKCKECDISLNSASALTLHLKSQHKIYRPIKCKVCGLSLSTETIFKQHMLTHTKEKPYECEQCGKRFREKGRLNSHIKVKHSGKLHICHICGLSFDLIHTLRTHYAVHSEEYKYKCEFCGKLFKMDRYLKQHLVTHTNLRLFKCELCEKTFTCSSALRMHMKGKHPKEVKALDAIGFRPKTRLPTVEELKAAYSPTKKIRSDNNSLDLNCKECNYHISSFVLYEEHMRKAHSNLLNAGLYKCLECEIIYESNYQLKNHYTNEHQNEQSIYQCKECNISLETANGLAKHAKSEHGINQPFVCNECGYCTSAIISLKSHMLKHTKETPYECEQCNKKFKATDRLKRHIRIVHLGIKQSRRKCKN